VIKLNRPECPHPSALKKRDYKHHRNKQALKISSFDKCMYCESKISHIDYAHVEHIKPKAADKFPDLEFDWSNLGYACPKCNNEKSDKYHVELPYINPYEDDPSDFFFASGSWLFIKNGNERADITIQDIALNRPELLEKRLERISDIQKSIIACFRTQNLALRQNALNELKKEADEDKEYSFFVKALLLAHEA